MYSQCTTLEVPPSWCENMLSADGEGEAFMTLFMVEMENIGRNCNKPYITVSNYETINSDGENGEIGS